VALLQEAIQRYLFESNIFETCSQESLVDSLPLLTNVFRTIATNEVASTIDRLQHIATVGDTWVGGKTRMYWLLRGMLRAQQIENVEGVLVDQIIENANVIIQQETSTADRITPIMVGSLIKGGTLLKVQQAKLQTPILAYDLNSDRVFVVDSWTLFTLRRQRESISRALKEAV
ncbi:MAG: hypothetical protein ACREX9_12640, partial [Gammaproteobacteria bacterium]